MNVFALNDAAVNDSNEVWSWYGASDMAIQASGQVIQGTTLSGDANIVTQSAGQAFAYLFPTGNVSSIALASAAQALYGRAGEGLSEIRLATLGQGTRRVMGASSVQIVFDVQGDGQAVGPISGTSTIEISAQADERVIQALLGVGQSNIIIDTALLPHRAKSVRLEPFEARIEAATDAFSHLIIKSPGGAALVALNANGSARFGGRVFLDPLSAAISLVARGSSNRRHYIYGEGKSVIGLVAASLLAGIPPIPTEYIPAPRSRTFVVPRDTRDMRVAHENRSL